MVVFMSMYDHVVLQSEISFEVDSLKVILLLYYCYITVYHRHIKIILLLYYCHTTVILLLFYCYICDIMKLMK